ncbi:MAG: hypothetical protein ACK4S4_15715 [Pyrinomonadaceae bacterium]
MKAAKHIETKITNAGTCLLKCRNCGECERIGNVWHDVKRAEETVAAFVELHNDCSAPQDN